MGSVGVSDPHAAAAVPGPSGSSKTHPTKARQNGFRSRHCTNIGSGKRIGRILIVALFFHPEGRAIFPPSCSPISNHAACRARRLVQGEGQKTLPTPSLCV